MKPMGIIDKLILWCTCAATSWPSGLRRNVKAVVLIGGGSNPLDVIIFVLFCSFKGVRGPSLNIGVSYILLPRIFLCKDTRREGLIDAPLILITFFT
jgi:hypothetical protein